MASAQLAVLGHLLAALLNAAFLGYLLHSRQLGSLRDRPVASFLSAVGISSAWGLASAAAHHGDWAPSVPLALVLDLLRYAAWATFLLSLLEPGASTGGHLRRTLGRIGLVLAFAVGVSLAGAAFVSAEAFGRPMLGLLLGLGIYELLLVEQLFRNQSDGFRWNAKPVCLALALVFGFDVYVYAEAVMFGRFDADALSVRGAVTALATPLLFVASRRQTAWLSKLKVSRGAAFYSASLLLVGVYLVFMAGVGYYVRYFGAEWGRALQVVLLAAALLFLAVMLLSGAARARLRVFLNKNFFSYRYDYRQEWLRFTAMLSSKSAPGEVGTLVVRGLADMVECPAGSLWSAGLDGERFVQTARWNSPASTEAEPVDSPFCRFMHEKEWIVDMEEFRMHPRRYGDLALPLWLVTNPAVWLVVPLIAGAQMIGFVALARPRTAVDLDWEVRDLLKTAARQAAGFLAQMQATEALLEVRKFDAFNRMSAFVVHDLKNIVTQLSLLMRNAERHRDNPEFQQDMLMTVQSSLEKMRQMMAQLREGAKPMGASSGVELAPMLLRLQAAVQQRGRGLELELIDRIATRGDEQRLDRVLGHLVQNALDATPASGKVWARLRQVAGRAEIVVGDTGHGMSQEFIETRLFRPFNSTKEGGMGIGAYESHQYIRELGGTLEVRSEPGRGSEITVLLPIFDAHRSIDLHMTSP